MTRANIGGDNVVYEQVIGKHGLRQLNENGGTRAEVCAKHSLVIGAIAQLTWAYILYGYSSYLLSNDCVTLASNHAEIDHYSNPQYVYARVVIGLNQVIAQRFASL